MRLTEILERFEKDSPVSVMARTTLDHIFDNAIWQFDVQQSTDQRTISQASFSTPQRNGNAADSTSQDVAAHQQNQQSGGGTELAGIASVTMTVVTNGLARHEQSTVEQPQFQLLSSSPISDNRSQQSQSSRLSVASKMIPQQALRGVNKTVAKTILHVIPGTKQHKKVVATWKLKGHTGFTDLIETPFYGSTAMTKNQPLQPPIAQLSVPTGFDQEPSITGNDVELAAYHQSGQSQAATP